MIQKIIKEMSTEKIDEVRNERIENAVNERIEEVRKEIIEYMVNEKIEEVRRLSRMRERRSSRK
jgi:hypothetical protein